MPIIVAYTSWAYKVMSGKVTAAYIRAQVEAFEARVKGGWASWSVGNHDVARVLYPNNP